MEDQVTSVEQSKRLLELGVPAEKTSMVWQKAYIYDRETNEITPSDSKILIYDGSRFSDDIPAFTVADLLVMLPAEIEDEDMTLEMSCSRYGESWAVQYYNQEHNYGLTYICYDLIGALYLAVTWLVNKGYKLNL